MKTSIHHRLRARLMLALVLLGLGRAAHADPVFDSFFSNNGSFEFGSAAPPLTFSSSFSTSTQITGWTMVAGGSQPQWLDDPNAEAGNRYIELNTIGGLAGWSSGAQIINGFAAFNVGSHYIMNFWAAGGVGVNNFLNLAFGSTTTAESYNLSVPSYTQAEFDALPSLQWSPYSVEFTAGDTTMNFNIFALNSGVLGQNSTIYLDNFSIAAIPEPGSMVLIGLVGVMALCSRRRRCMPRR
jgi:hypothetical protein